MIVSCPSENGKLLGFMRTFSFALSSSSSSLESEMNYTTTTTTTTTTTGKDGRGRLRRHMNSVKISSKEKVNAGGQKVY